MNVAVASVKTYNKKSIKHERGRSLCLLIEKSYIPKFVTYSLQIDSEEKGHLDIRGTAIPAHFLMGRTCAGSECSKNSGYLGPRGIVVDTTPVL
jgi:hypothetical protein